MNFKLIKCIFLPSYKLNLMKIGSISFTIKGLAAILLLFLSSFGVAQTDTLHLYYHHTQIAPPDSIQAKIEKWAKGLTGKHVDITVVAYFHKPEFKKFSQQRLDELFITLNRKARNVITIESMTTKKGQDYQRTMVDIIYKPTLSPEEVAAAKAKAEAEAAKAKEEEKKKKEEEKAAKDAEKKNKEGEKKSKTDVAAEQTVDGDSKEEGKKDKKDGKNEGKEDADDADYGQASSRTIGEGNSMSLEELKYVKASKIIVALTGKKEIDENLYNAVKRFWTFNSNIVQMPYDEARKLGKENKKDTSTIISFIQVRTWITEKHGPVTVKILCIGYAMALENSKGKLLMKQFIPKQKGKVPSEIYFGFGVTFLNNLCYIMDQYQLSKSGKADPYFDLQTPELKNKTLVISEEQLHPKLPRVEIPTYYTSPYRIVTEKEWQEIIMEKKDFAYSMVVPIPANPTVYWHYLMDAKTGRVLLFDRGPAVTLTPGFGVKNLNASQSGFIDKANFERYEKGIADAINDNANRADDKAKDEEKAKEKAAKKEKDAEAKKAKQEKEEAEKKDKEEKKKKKD